MARLAGGGRPGPVTVSTLAEAEYLAAAGWRDILYATAMAPAKVARAARIQRDTGATLRLVVDRVSALPALKPAERIVDSVHAALRAAILDGSLAPGQALSVPELSRQLDVSRSPVREAVLALVADGLAVEQPRRGVAVAAMEAADMLEIHEVRESVEA